MYPPARIFAPLPGPGAELVNTPRKYFSIYLSVGAWRSGSVPALAAGAGGIRTRYLLLAKQRGVVRQAASNGRQASGAQLRCLEFLGRS